MSWKFYYKIFSFLPEPNIKTGDVIICRTLSALEKDMKALIDLYKQVFGEYDVSNGSVWGEGAYCEKEGRDKKIDIDTYRRLLIENKPLCKCGGKYVEYHTSSEVKKRIELNFRDSESSCCVLKKINEHIVGFSWAGVFSVQKMADKIDINLVKKVQYENYSHLFCDSLFAIFIEEIALSSLVRGNIKNVLELLIPLLEYDAYDRIPVIFRTRKSSKIYKIIKNLDYNEVVLDSDYVLVSFSNSRKLRKLIKWYYNTATLINMKKVKI